MEIHKFNMKYFIFIILSIECCNLKQQSIEITKIEYAPQQRHMSLIMCGKTLIPVINNKPAHYNITGNNVITKEIVNFTIDSVEFSKNPIKINSIINR